MRDKIHTLNEIRQKWMELARNVKDRFGNKVNLPEQIYYVENRSFLARVWSSPHRVGRLEINTKCLLPENWDYFMSQVIPHEFCHAWNAAKGNDDSHGEGWKLCMRLLGVYPSRCGSWPSDKKVDGMRPVCHSRSLIDLSDY